MCECVCCFMLNNINIEYQLQEKFMRFNICYILHPIVVGDQFLASFSLDFVEMALVTDFQGNCLLMTSGKGYAIYIPKTLGKWTCSRGTQISNADKCK